MIHTVAADYSQFYLRAAGEAFEMDDYDKSEFSAGLARIDSLGQVMLVACRQHGQLPVDLELLDARPADLSAQWQDVVEFSVTPESELLLEGWEGGDGMGVGNIPGVSYRVQYAIADADLSETTEPDNIEEKYLIRLWPEETRPAQIMRNESARAQYWTFQQDADRALLQVADLPFGTRTAAIIDIALNDHPETARRIREGDKAFRVGIMAYTQKIRSVEMEYAEVENLIDERAART